MHSIRGLRAGALLPVAVVAAVVAGSTALATPEPKATAAAHDHHQPLAASGGHALTARQAAFHDAMRKLWEDHVTWTRLAIVSFAGNLPDLPATEARLLRNQADIGNAIRPFYGHMAARSLTRLLREHILGAVALLQAAKAGDAGQVASARAAWYDNGNQVADFLHAANPRHWPRREMRTMMRTHLDQTLSEAQNQLGGRFKGSVRDYDAIHRHILEMADMLSTGIIEQFPQRFR
jgi:hypothetical protein